MSDDNIRDLWREQPTEPISITLEDIQNRAKKFERRIRSRNLREYAAGVILIPVYIAFALRNHGWRIAPSLLQLAGVLVVLYELHRRASPARPNLEAGLNSSVESYIQDLERQRKALASVWLWYLMPLVPGLVAGMILGAIDHPDRRLGIFIAFSVVIFAGIWALNARGARRLEAQIKELRTVSSEREEDV